MKKPVHTISTVVALLVLAVIVGVSSNQLVFNRINLHKIPPEISKYFAERMVLLGIEDVGHPIEGFDDNLLRIAYPGIRVEDFDEVKAFEGKYELQGSALAFTRTAGSPVSSAERTISEEGYGRLLKNLTLRLGLPAQSKSDVDKIIEKINTAEYVDVRLGTEGSALGITIKPSRVLEDSRCPVNVNCFYAGQVRLETTLQSGSGKVEQVFLLGETVTTEAEQITLEQVSPTPTAGVKTAGKDYAFKFKIEKR